MPSFLDMTKLNGRLAATAAECDLICRLSLPAAWSSYTALLPVPVL